MKALAFSGGKDSMVCLHLLRGEFDCAIYVDTGFAYPETLALVEYAAAMVPMHVVKSDRAAQNDRHGIPSDVVPVDWTTAGQDATCRKSCAVQSYLECCYQNIARPLFMKAQALGVTELVYGQRNDEGHRGCAKDGDVVLGIVRRQPIEDWTEADVMAYLASKMDVPEHYKIKHSSLDCYDCTAFRRDSADRIAYTRAKHPVFYAQYAKRVELLDTALSQALCP
jgi:phosphoadenosine phosphosulfate reductase